MQLKFVISNREDFDEVIKIIDTNDNFERLWNKNFYLVFQPNNQVDDYWSFMAKLVEWSKELPKELKLRILPQLHYNIWGNKRGV